MDKRRKRLRTRLFLGVAFGMTGLVLIAYAFHFGFFESLESQSVDMRFSLRGAKSQPKNLAIVTVDDRTFSDLAVRWPFNRKLHSKIIDRICAGHPAAIAMDIQFSEYGTVDEDNALGQALYDCKGKVALATTEVSPTTPGAPNLIFDAAALKQFRATAGDSNFSTDKADVIRKMPYQIQGLNSFAIGAAEIATGKTITRSDMGDASQWIDFAGPPAVRLTRTRASFR